jgi:hypothetical protein
MPKVFVPGEPYARRYTDVGVIYGSVGQERAALRRYDSVGKQLGALVSRPVHASHGTPQEYQCMQAVLREGEE